MGMPIRRRVTPQEYLAIERSADRRSQYVDGEIYAMAGATRRHNLITLSVGSTLRLQLKGRPCEVYVNDMRVKVSKPGMYTYPDVVVVCGMPQFEDDEMDTLVNPTVVIEVLSPTTEAHDRGDKAEHYRRLDSLKEYVLIAQDRPLVERYVRQPNDEWVFSEAYESDSMVHVSSIDCELRVSEIYSQIKFV